jgi:hypothetical protein
MPRILNRTPPFRRLQSRIGSATYRLNTIFVGLESIAEGRSDTGALAVTWRAPPAGSERQVANQARIFASAGALVLAGDLVDAFVKELASEKWLTFSDQASSIATKAANRSKEQGGDYSVAERFEALCSDLGMSYIYEVAVIDLMVKWRNVVAHSADRTPKLGSSNKAILLEHSTAISEKYSHLNIRLAIENFERRKTPVPKEITSLIAIVVNFCRKLDQASIRRVAGTESGMERSVDSILTRYFSEHSKAKSFLAEILQGDYGSRLTAFGKLLSNLGISEAEVSKGRAAGRMQPAGTAIPVSGLLNDLYVQDIANSSLTCLCERFDVN